MDILLIATVNVDSIHQPIYRKLLVLYTYATSPGPDEIYHCS